MNAWVTVLHRIGETPRRRRAVNIVRRDIAIKEGRRGKKEEKNKGEKPKKYKNVGTKRSVVVVVVVVVVGGEWENGGKRRTTINNNRLGTLG